MTTQRSWEGPRVSRSEKSLAVLRSLARFGCSAHCPSPMRRSCACSRAPASCARRADGRCFDSKNRSASRAAAALAHRVAAESVVASPVRRIVKVAIVDELMARCCCRSAAKVEVLDPRSGRSWGTDRRSESGCLAVEIRSADARTLAKSRRSVFALWWKRRRLFGRYEKEIRIDREFEFWVSGTIF